MLLTLILCFQNFRVPCGLRVGLCLRQLSALGRVQTELCHTPIKHSRTTNQHAESQWLCSTERLVLILIHGLQVSAHVRRIELVEKELKALADRTAAKEDVSRLRTEVKKLYDGLHIGGFAVMHP